MKNSPHHPMATDSCPSSASRLRDFALLPVPVFLAAIGLLAVLKPTPPAEEPVLLLALNLVFSALASLLVVVLVTGSYLRHPAPSLLALGCGMLLWGAAGTVGPAVLGRGPNATVTTHNLLVMLSALCHFTGGALVAVGHARRGRPVFVLSAAYALCAGIVWLVTVATLHGWLPVFFVPGQGGTPVRQAVLVAAVVLFAGAVAVLWRGRREARTAFLHWYGMSLLLVATGLVGVLAQKMTGSALSWTARAAQLLGGAYMVAAAVAALRESGGRIALNAAVWDERLLQVLTPRYLWSLPAVWRYALALGCVVAATALRVALIPVLGTVAAYHVMLATAVGVTALLGFGPGLLTVILAGVAVDVCVFGAGFGVERFGRLAASLAVGMFVCYVLHGIRVAALKARASEERFRLVNERYELVLEGADTAIWDWDVANHRVLYSPRWKAMRGLGEHEVTEAESEWSARIHPEDASRVQAAVEAHFAGRAPVFAEEYRVRHKEGHWLWIADRGLARRDAAGHVVRMAGSETDITARKHAEEKLRLSEETLAKTFDAAATAMALTRLADGRLLAVNDRWLELMELRREGVIGKTSAELDGWKNPADREAMLRQLRERGVVRDFECVLCARNGREWTALFSAQAVTIRGERVLVSSAIDITARKRMEAALAETTELLETLLAQAPLGFAYLDRELRFVRVNEPLAAINGLPVAAHIGKTIADIVPALLPAAEALAAKILATGEAVVGHEFSGETSAQSGVTRYWSESWYPVRDAGGAVAGFGVLVEEITARKQMEAALRESERRLSLAASGTGIGIFDRNIATGVISATEQNLRLLGLRATAAATTTLSQAYTYQQWAERVHPADRPRVEAEIQRCMAERASFESEYRVAWLDGSEHWLSVRGVFQYDGLGQPTRLLGILMDITARKRSEAQLKAALHEKEVLLKEVHHRVKNNMQVLSSLVSLQEESLVKSLVNGHSSLEGGGEPRDRCPTTYASLLNAFAEVRDRIRTMALVHESLYQSESLARIDFAQYAAGLTAYLSRAHGRGTSGVRLRLDVEPVSLPVESAVPCGLILNELVTNAYKHAFHDRPSGEVVIRLRADSAGQVSLTVSDDGQGMPAEFDWRQASSLGLRLVQMLAGQLEGTAECRRREGGGTEFVVEFGAAADDP